MMMDAQTAPKATDSILSLARRVRASNQITL
jgi:hypothetical protein